MEWLTKIWDSIKSLFSGGIDGFRDMIQSSGIKDIFKMFSLDYWMGGGDDAQESAVDSDLEKDSIKELFAIATDISTTDPEFGKKLEEFAVQIEESLIKGDLDLTTITGRVEGKMESLSATFAQEAITSADDNLAFNKLKSVFNDGALNNVDKITQILSIKNGLEQANAYVAANTPTDPAVTDPNLVVDPNTPS